MAGSSLTAGFEAAVHAMTAACRRPAAGVEDGTACPSDHYLRLTVSVHGSAVGVSRVERPPARLAQATKSAVFFVVGDELRAHWPP